MSFVYPGVGSKIARMKDLGPVLDAAAEEVEKLMIGVAADHIDTGDYVDSIRVSVDKSSPSKQDRFVGPSDPGAEAIEYGWTDEQGRVHAGQHIVQKTLSSLPRV